ncbi:hypothetical protein NBH00_23065 [Paraconexibacter antarcticus]|uniref:Uncharacterized protein n=1 Tax=Paraconexibacter antarcticus TaxID=2949664 RepID=A0ABY5DQB0_9ACTN|nr:hypothetical protein [Paraconexibacter antarcticus]UTI64206.1 hypothetical protein NBH00_23065 [Paraconexibacter antarcticus]
MPSTPLLRLRRRVRTALLPVALGAGLVALAAPAGASAAFQCDASALRGSVLGAPALEPVTANRTGTVCTSQSAGGAAAGAALSALPLNASVLGASTYVTPAGTANDKQAVLAQGGLGSLTVKALPTLPIALPTATIPANLQSITVPLGTVTSALGISPLVLALIPGLPANLTFDLTAAIDGILPNGQLPNVDLFSVGAATAYAGANCSGGRARTFGLAQTADITVLGQQLPTEAIVDQTLDLDTGKAILSSLDVTEIPLPTGLPAALTSLLSPLLSTIQTVVLKPLVVALPDVPLPVAVAEVKLTPSSQSTSATGRLVQQGPHLQVSVAGQRIVDVVLGEATVSASGVDCTVPAAAAPVEPAVPESAADLALACTSRRLVLVDVLQKGRRVKLLGAADRKLAGRTVALRLAATGRTVATAKVATDGSFSATAPLPPARIRGTNRARYQAAIGREKSLDLKLARRMVVSAVSARGGRVTIAGRVILPLASPRANITLTRRLSCRRSEVVKRFRPAADGTFKVTVDAPDDATAAVYRMSTVVRRTTRSHTTSPTYTLPRGVNLTR